MFVIPNSLLIDESAQKRLRGLFESVESTKEFQLFRNKEWSIDLAEIASNIDVISNFVEHGERRQQEWGPELRRAIKDVPELAVYGVAVSSREGLEHLPTHVLGRHFTFFVDPMSCRTLFTIVGLFSS